MCEFCVQHGEGKKWYEVMENYSRELFEQGNRRKYLKEFMINFEAGTSRSLAILRGSKKAGPAVQRFVGAMATRLMKRYHFGQVVPLEDVEMIIDLVRSVTRLPCVCRKAATGRKNARYCLALGVDPLGTLGDYPDLTAQFEVLTAEQAKAFVRDWDREGLVHTVWTFKTPFIGGICNCDRDCMAYRIQVAEDLAKLMFKGEYLAQVDQLSCNGCRNCRRACHFGAIDYALQDKKCSINLRLCYGCGLCRAVCPRHAITLTPRLAGQGW